MSYFADHLAWQQRVAQEFKASSQFMDRQSDFSMTQGFPTSSQGGVGNQDMLSYNTLNSGHRTANDFRRSFTNHPLSQTNLALNQPGSVPAFNNNAGGAIITKKDLLRERSLNAAGKQSLVGLKPGLNPYSYVPRSKQQVKRSNTAGKYGGNSFVNNQGKLTFQQQLLQKKNQIMQNTIDPQVPRFNENNMDTLSVKKSQGGPRSIISTHSKQASRSIVNGQLLRPTTSGGKVQMNQSHASGFNKQKILEAVEKLSEKDLEKMSRILKVDNDEKIQQDQLQEDQSQVLQEELNDRVDDLQDIEGAGDREETMSRVSRGSRFSAIPKSEISRLSSKTYIYHLQTELEEEKQARLKLERELDELKKLSSEISSHLGLNKK
eukprot:403371067